MQSSFTKISRHKHGCRLPAELSDRSTPDYMPGECKTLNMTPEDWEKYGPVNAAAAAARAAKKKLQQEKEAEKEMALLTTETLKELLAQGKTCEQINQELYPHKPGFVLSLARRKKLIPEEGLPPVKTRAKKQEKISEGSIMQQSEKEAIDFRSQLVGLAEFLRTFPSLNPAEDLTKEDAELLLAIDTLIEYNVRAELRETQQTVQNITKILEEFQTESKQILRNLDENTVKLQQLCEDTMKFAHQHRHQVGAGHWSAIPDEVIS